MSLRLKPGFWIALQAVVVFSVLQVAGSFEPEINPDSAGYSDMALGSLGEALSDTKTVGYPLFLRAVERIAGTYLAAPYFHFLAFVAAVLSFYVGLQVAGFSSEAAAIAASILLYSRALLDFVSAIGPDVLALSLGVATVSALLIALRRPVGVLGWLSLACLTLITYQVRPAYLFLVVFVPCIGGFLAFCIFRTPFNWTGLRIAALLAASALLPFLLFCAARWFVTGHFGLVSFGGYNLIGISGQLLHPGLVNQLPESTQSLAREILARRPLHPRWREPEDGAAMEELYNVTVWEISVPAARELYGDQPVEVNQALGHLAREIIQLRPLAYARWLVWAGRTGVRRVLSLLIIDPGTRLCLIAAALLEGIVLVRRWRYGVLPPPFLPTNQAFVETHVLLWLALTFAATKLLLVILVETPLERYLASAIVFAPPLIGVLTWHRYQQLFLLGVAQRSVQA